MKYRISVLDTLLKPCQALSMKRWGGRGGGWVAVGYGDRKAQTSCLPHFAFPAPLPFLALLPFGLFWLWNINHCYIISPISLPSQPIRTPTSLPFSSPAYCTYHSCPPPCYCPLLPCPFSPCDSWMRHTYFYSRLPTTRPLRKIKKVWVIGAQRK